ncbi:hypothetical protein GY45DRAFT_604162 [Cubamyces sp. BRFM 1775]|nr:hypothetical protein GY45DRAFT_604162 [Cubamyces sp. BRFM 1775]
MKAKCVHHPRCVLSFETSSSRSPGWGRLSERHDRPLSIAIARASRLCADSLGSFGLLHHEHATASIEPTEVGISTGARAQQRDARTVCRSGFQTHPGIRSRALALGATNALPLPRTATRLPERGCRGQSLQVRVQITHLGTAMPCPQRRCTDAQEQRRGKAAPALALHSLNGNTRASFKLQPSTSIGTAQQAPRARSEAPK